MAQKHIKVLVYIKRRSLEVCPLSLGCCHDGCRIEVKQVVDEEVRMLRLDAIGRQC